MSHNHDHSHDHSEHPHDHGGHSHDHSHSIDINKTSKALVLGIALNVVFVVAEALVGFFSNSLALLADAGHNLTDVAGLLIAYLAFKISAAKPTEAYTYGYKKTTILAALTNAAILLITVGVIFYGAYKRFNVPIEINGKVVMITAIVGIIINGITAMLFFKDRKKDINIKGAFLHMAADALVSLGVVISGALIMFSQFFWIDSVVSLMIAVVIFLSTWGLLKQSVRMSLDGVPHSIAIEKVNEAILAISGVAEVHHIHIWALSTTENALTAHIVLEKDVDLCDLARIKSEIRHLLEHNGIHHSTLEIEHAEEICGHKEH